MKITVGELKDTGINEIDVDLVVKKWNRLWMLTEWQRDNSWRIIKYLRKDSPITKIKITISWRQANELVKILNLKSMNSCCSIGFSWRREEDID